MAINRVFIAADEALKSATAADRTSEEVDKKFRVAIHMLSGFEKDFASLVAIPLAPTFGSDTGFLEGKMSDNPESPLTTLYALKENLHSKVKFPSVCFYLSTLTNPSQWEINYRNQQGQSSFISLAPFLIPTLLS